MKQLARLTAALAFHALLAGAALASGGVTCTADDAQVTLEAGAVLSHGAGSMLSNPQGSLVVKAGTIPADMRTFDLSGGLIHHWMAGGETKLDYYFERPGAGAFGSLELIIDTKDDPESVGSKGRYLIKTYDMTPPADKEGGKAAELSGDIECVLE